MTSPSYILAHAFALGMCYIMIDAALSFQNVDDALAFYGVYHRDPINQLIHFFGVPCIIWSFLVFFAHLNISSSIKINIPGAPSHHLNYATLVTLGYLIFYLHLDRFGGALFAPVLYLYYVTATSLTLNDQKQASSRLHKKTDSRTPAVVPWTGTGRVLRNAILLNLFGWYVQIHPGHAIFEGATPAALQSMGGALTSAPLFAFYEGLWLLGINGELQVKILELVDVYTRELCESGEVVMRACEGVVGGAIST